VPLIPEVCSGSGRKNLGGKGKLTIIIYGFLVCQVTSDAVDKLCSKRK